MSWVHQNCLCWPISQWLRGVFMTLWVTPSIYLCRINEPQGDFFLFDDPNKGTETPLLTGQADPILSKKYFQCMSITGVVWGERVLSGNMGPSPAVLEAGPWSRSFPTLLFRVLVCEARAWPPWTSASSPSPRHREPLIWSLNAWKQGPNNKCVQTL